MEKFLGVDVGGTNVKFGVVTADGLLHNKVKYPTETLNKGGEFVAAFLDAMDEQLKQHCGVKKVGIGVPGMLSEDRKRTLKMANIPALNHVALHKKLEKKFSKHTFFLENDANVAALGELYFGKKDIPPTYLFITLGTGVGSAAIINRKIFHGGQGNAMEAGHLIASNGKTVEQNIGKTGILKIAQKTIANYKGKSVLKDEKKPDTKTLIKAALKNDPLAQEIFEEVGKYLGECLVSLIRVLDIGTVLIGGGVAKAFPLMEKNMHHTLKKYLPDYYLDTLHIRPATLGNTAGIVGAASLCFMQ